MDKTLVISQDDCAPDAREYFDNKMKSIVGYTIEGFKARASAVIKKDDHSEYVLNNYVLTISADDPFYKLYKLK